MASFSDNPMESMSESEDASNNEISPEKRSNCEGEIWKYCMDIKIKREEYAYGTLEIAQETVELMKKIISKAEWKSAEDIANLLTIIGEKLAGSSHKHSYLIANMVRRVLKIIRDEYHAATSNKRNHEEEREPDSLHTIMTRTDAEDYSKVIDELRDSVIEHIGEYQMELETSFDLIIKQANKHIHAKEVIMTTAYSKLLQDFLLEAKGKKFHAYVVNNENDQGRKLAHALGSAGIETTLIKFNNVMAFMPIVNKVILGTNTIMADGGLRAIIGSRNLAQAANYYKKPVLVVTPIYKISSKNFGSESEANFQVFDSPLKIIDPSKWRKETLAKLKVIVPIFGWVPPELVTTFITNVGGFAPSYIYRLLSELYHPNEKI